MSQTFWGPVTSYLIPKQHKCVLGGSEGLTMSDLQTPVYECETCSENSVQNASDPLLWSPTSLLPPLWASQA